jgi:hypothetical protein
MLRISLARESSFRFGLVRLGKVCCICAVMLQDFVRLRTKYISVTLLAPLLEIPSTGSPDRLCDNFQ